MRAGSVPVHALGLSGPDFLEAVADAEAAIGNDINADTYRQRAQQWKREADALEAAEAKSAALQARIDQFTQLARAA